MTPEVSVIIPTYNRRAMVREAIASVLAQREANFELIVVDDGSSDGTAESLSDIDDVTVERIEHRGPAAARNRGVEIVRAPLIAFLDSDDLWAPDKLHRQFAFMCEHPDCAISQTAEIWIRDGRRVNPGLRHLKRAGDIFLDSLQTCLISPSAVIMKTSLFRALGGFDEDLAAAEDYDLWLRILVDHEAGLLDEPLVTRRAGHADQLSASIPALDRFRVLALMKLLKNDRLSDHRRSAVIDVLVEKCGILAHGARRRRLSSWSALYEDVASMAQDRRVSSSKAILSTASTMREMLRGETNHIASRTQDAAAWNSEFGKFSSRSGWDDAE